MCKKLYCNKWDSNPRSQKWSAIRSVRIRPLGQPSYELLFGTNIYIVCDSLHLQKVLSGAGFEPMPTGMDCDLKAAP